MSVDMKLREFSVLRNTHPPGHTLISTPGDTKSSLTPQEPEFLIPTLTSVGTFVQKPSPSYKMSSKPIGGCLLTSQEIRKPL